jgi:hypothetical protein
VTEEIKAEKKVRGSERAGREGGGGRSIAPWAEKNGIGKVAAKKY